MSGHSKWSTIKNKKAKTDSARAKIFTKVSKEIYVAVKNGGADVENNRKLRDLIVKAKANNLPSENIERVIKKAAGDFDKKSYEEVVYEGYGPSGVAILVEALTDNRNRTASNVRHYFGKFGGKLAASGCVNFMFQEKGFVQATKNALDEETVMEICLNLNVLDFEVDGNLLNVEVEVPKIADVADSLKAAGFEILFAQVRKIANNFVSFSNQADLDKFNLLVQTLEDDDDVQQVWTNFEECVED